MDILLNENERLDDLEYKGMRLIQDKNGYCFTSDAVLLANLVRAGKNDVVADFGCGNGVVALLVAAKTTAKSVIGIEMQECAFELAERNVALNAMQDRIRLINDDIANADKVLGKESVSVVVCNPPYFEKNSGQKRISESVALSRHESTCSLDDIITKASEVLKFGGKLWMIHKCERMAEVLTSMSNRGVEPKKVTLIYPKADKIPDTFVVEGKKSSAHGMKIDSIIVYDQEGNMTEQAKKLYNKS
ncbi:MAG: tRNA1(Val) (adenine(37)-N6)-methyltransferase [Eubacteriales bacterium]|nr:tRNA1(Val) (adenine(37)-N6)-methyltransferase [Eubacteriales bacterium]